MEKSTLKKDCHEVTILAMGHTRQECPFNTEEVWGCNTGYRQLDLERDGRIGYFSKIFLAHTQVIHPNGGYKVFNWDEMNYLHDILDIEILNIHRVTGLKSTLYPIDRIDKKMECQKYFSDTIAYMIAYALYKWTVKDKVTGRIRLKDNKPYKIYMYGVDMLTFDEYGLEKGGIEYWIGYGQGLGVKFIITSESTLLKTISLMPYGAEDTNMGGRKSKMMKFFKMQSDLHKRGRAGKPLKFTGIMEDGSEQEISFT